MNAKTTIRKVLFIAFWLCIGGGMLTLLLAAISKKNKGTCRDYTITIKGAKNNLFIDEKDVEQLLMKATNGNIKGELVSSFRLHELSNMLENNTWIDEAELYFDNQDVLHVTVTEKEPVARVFTTAGQSFYIDSAGRNMPLSDKLSARVPVFTGFPDKKKFNQADSMLLLNVKEAANLIMKEPFWMSQVAQIDITPERNFEMIPVIGNHVVKLGDGTGMKAKLRRLMIFYQQVMSKTGFDAYKVIDVQYKGQVVASRYAGDAKIDSVQLRKNVEKLLRQSQEAMSDTVSTFKPQPTIKLEADSETEPNPAFQDKNAVNVEQVNPNPLKSSSPAKDKSNSPVKNNKPPAKPKAVMPKKPAPAEDNNSEYN